MNKPKIWAYVKGGAIKATGTIKEISSQLAVDPNTLYWYRTPSYRDRAARYQEKNLIEIVPIKSVACKCGKPAEYLQMTIELIEEPMCRTCFVALGGTIEETGFIDGRR